MPKRRNVIQMAALAAGAGYLAACSNDGNEGAAGTTPPVPTPASASPVPSKSVAPVPNEILNGPRDKPNVALTFHGQGDATMAKKLLAALDAGNAKGTILAVGTWLTSQPDMAKLILDKGHELGNHTQTHGAISGMKQTDMFNEIDKCAQTLKKLTGSIGAWFRPSQTQFANEQIKIQAAKIGYRGCVSYDLDSMDYTDPGVNAIVRNVLNGVQNGSIISLHFGHAGTITAMPQILDGLAKRGFKPVTMTELVA